MTGISKQNTLTEHTNFLCTISLLDGCSDEDYRDISFSGLRTNH